MKNSALMILVAITAFAASASARSWVHPGTLDGKVELDYAKTQLAAKAQPYTFEFTTMKNNEGGLSKAPSPQTTIDANSGAAEAARDDARRTYGNALAWCLTGDTTYARQSVAYLNAWSGLQSITARDEQNRLVAGWIGSLFGPAADLMLGFSGWQATDIENFRAMFKRAFYPVLNTASTWNGNVDLHQICAMMAIAVFCEDSSEFNLGLTRLAARVPSYFFLTSDGRPPAIAGDGGNYQSFWSNPTKWVDGLTQETCRDNNHHAQFAMSAALGAMETAWHQGVDVYTTYQTRMVAALELMGLQCSSGQMQNTCANNSTSGDVYDTWEIGYNHYHNRKGIALPNAWAMISKKVRSADSNPGSWNIFYESLTHADIPYAIPVRKEKPSIRSSHTGHSFSTSRNGMIRLGSGQSGDFQIRTLALNGSVVNQTTVHLAAGECRQVWLGVNPALSGIYMIQVRSAAGTAVIKYFM